jgi:hypothetical protein
MMQRRTRRFASFQHLLVALAVALLMLSPLPARGQAQRQEQGPNVQPPPLPPDIHWQIGRGVHGEHVRSAMIPKSHPQHDPLVQQLRNYGQQVRQRFPQPPRQGPGRRGEIPETTAALRPADECSPLGSDALRLLSAEAQWPTLQWSWVWGCPPGWDAVALWDVVQGWGYGVYTILIDGAPVPLVGNGASCPYAGGCTFWQEANYDRNPNWAVEMVDVYWTGPVVFLDAWCEP